MEFWFFDTLWLLGGDAPQTPSFIYFLSVAATYFQFHFLNYVPQTPSFIYFLSVAATCFQFHFLNYA